MHWLSRGVSNIEEVQRALLNWQQSITVDKLSKQKQAISAQHRLMLLKGGPVMPIGENSREEI